MTRSFNKAKLPILSTATLQPLEEWLDTVTGDLSIEVGAGVGLHAIQLAKQEPQNSVLAVERTKEKFQRLYGRVYKHSLPNLKAVHAEATILLPQLLDQGSVTKFFFLYPNPYPKTSQKNLRWGHSPFMHFVFEALKPGGQLVFATNILSYKDELLAEIPKFGFTLADVCEVIPNTQKFPKPRTHFEKKYLSRAETCWNLIFKN